MSESPPRVAILGRSGPARDHLHRALTELGGEIALEGDPADLAPERVIESRATVVVVSLDAAMEDQLDAWDPVFAADGINVVFDEAETTGRLDGWDLARWARHLATKVLGHGDTLPPPPEDASRLGDRGEWIPTPGAGPTPAEQMDAERFEDYAADAPELAAHVPVADGPGVADAPTAPAAEVAMPEPSRADDDGDQSLYDELQELADAPHSESELSFDIDDGFQSGGEATDASAAAPVDTSGLELEPLDLDADEEALGLDEDVARLAAEFDTGSGVASAGEHDSGVEVASVPDDAQSSDDDGSPVPGPTAETSPASPDTAAESAPPAWSGGFGNLELAPQDDAPVEAAPAARPAAAGLSIDDLASAFQLEASDEELAEQAVIVLLSGMGGPDALRQFLSSLPPDFPVPVVVWQQLNAGTHDRLAAQLAKTGRVDTYIAAVGQVPEAGRVAVLPPGVGLDASKGLVFTASEASPQGLFEGVAALGGRACVIALSGAESSWVEGREAFIEGGGLLLAQSPQTCFEGQVCASLIQDGCASADPSALASLALDRFNED
ncbi:MAG: chemotaxis protein CheB [Lysobacteraceae bacterium]